ncbi:MAG: hypothetical protein ACI8QC_004223, partial [Planctomycetota bacterium]
MASVVFVAPYSLESTLRFVRAAAGLPDVTLGIVAQESAEAFAQKLPAEERGLIAGHVQVADAKDPDQLEAGVRELASSLG